MYSYAVVIITLFLMGFLWLMWQTVVLQVRAGIISQMATYENETAYATFELADIFVFNVWTFFLLIMMFGLLFFVIVYAQRKGRLVYMQ